MTQSERDELRRLCNSARQMVTMVVSQGATLHDPIGFGRTMLRWIELTEKLLDELQRINDNNLSAAA